MVTQLPFASDSTTTCESPVTRPAASTSSGTCVLHIRLRCRSFPQQVAVFVMVPANSATVVAQFIITIWSDELRVLASVPDIRPLPSALIVMEIGELNLAPACAGAEPITPAARTA